MADTAALRLQKPVTAAILAGCVDPRDDIAAERARATFASARLAEALHGGAEGVAKRRELVKLAKAEPTFNKDSLPFLSRKQRYVRGIKVATKLFDMVFETGIERDDAMVLHKIVCDGSLTGLDLHWGMFVPTLASQASEDQMDLVGQAMQLQIIGTYAQTELGHGTYIRGLETTATYDPDAEQFILHSPTVTSTKWWPGGLAKTVTHAIVMARLFVGATDHGLQAFCVQLRDLDTHMPLRGVTLGDIGPKMGFAAVDNGYLQFDHVRIPRQAMLMKLARVEKDGTYVKPPVAKANYGTMVQVRSMIVRSASYALGKAVTIAVRYSAVRRQTAHDGRVKETQVLDYQNTQASLLPLLATTYAFHFAGLQMKEMYEAFEDQREAGSFDALPELHATAAALKAVCTWVTSAGIETCRLCCGGHGYSRFSGLPSLYEDYVASATYEGENNVLCLQTARYLLKSLAKAKRKEKLGPMLQYLAGAACTSRVTSAKACADDHESQVAAAAHLARSLVGVAAARVNACLSKGMTQDQARNANIMDLIAAAKAHCNLVILRTFLRGARSIANVPARRVVLRLVSLFALHHIIANGAELLSSNHFSAAQLKMVADAYRALLLELRPNAVGLVDALCYDDFELNSCLGREDGDVYRALLERASSKHNPMNDSVVGPAWESAIKPLLGRSKL